MEQRIDTQVRLIARQLDERADEVEGLIVLAVTKDGKLKHAHTSMSREERDAMLDAAHIPPD